MLATLVKGADVREYKGRYKIQLEIPPSSTLSPSDITQVAYFASWAQDPNEAPGYEGLRSILINRQSPITKKGIQLSALQISGIGSRKPVIRNGLQEDPTGPFNIPSGENFISMMPGTLMSTSYAKDGRLAGSRPTYRAFGTHTLEELRTKLEKTNTASRFQLEEMVTPHVEAYGRYLDSELSNEEGPFGFIVFPVPSVSQQRIAADIIEKYQEALPNRSMTVPEAAFGFYTVAGVFFAPIVQGARELHDKERHAHLQLHLSNAYLCDGFPYVMDWSTLTPLGSNREDNIVFRTIDLLKPQEGAMKLFMNTFGSLYPPTTIDVLSSQIHELSMEVYSGDLKHEVDIMQEIMLAKQELRRGNLGDFDIVAHWLKAQGFEGFPKRKKTSVVSGGGLPNLDGGVSKTSPVKRDEKVGRNAKCPCGSGKKYKKCCGGH